MRSCFGDGPHVFSADLAHMVTTASEKNKTLQSKVDNGECFKFPSTQKCFLPLVASLGCLALAVQSDVRAEFHT